jgi:hypothetical protein
MYIMQKGTVLPVRCQSMVGEYKQTVDAHKNGVLERGVRSGTRGF